jgi:outer membrane protein
VRPGDLEEEPMVKKIVLVIALMVLVVPTIAQAQESWIFRVRAIDIAPDASSSQILNTGTSVDVDSAWTVEVDLTYMFSEHVGLELIAATASHDLSTTGGALGGADAGSVWVLPPTLTLQYFFGTGTIRPYIGAGINYTVFYGYDLSDDLASLGITDVTFSNSFGFDGDVGVDLSLGGNWVLNLDIKYIQISTDADLKVGSDTLDTISVDVDPWVFGIGAGIRF